MTTTPTLQAYQVQHPFLKEAKEKGALPDELILVLNSANYKLAKDGVFSITTAQGEKQEFRTMLEVENNIVNRLKNFVLKQRAEILLGADLQNKTKH